MFRESAKEVLGQEAVGHGGCPVQYFIHLLQVLQHKWLITKPAQVERDNRQTKSRQGQS
jgi:hypothetical protein